MRVVYQVTGEDAVIRQGSEEVLAGDHRLRDVRVTSQERGQRVGYAFLDRQHQIRGRDDHRIDQHVEDVVTHLVGRHVQVLADVRRQNSVAVPEHEEVEAGNEDGVVELVSALGDRHVGKREQRLGEGREAVCLREAARIRKPAIHTGLDEPRVIRGVHELEVGLKGLDAAIVEHRCELAREPERVIQIEERHQARGRGQHRVWIVHEPRAIEMAREIDQGQGLPGAAVECGLP